MMKYESLEELKNEIDLCEKKVSENPSDFELSKRLNELKSEFTKRNLTAQKESSPAIQKFHTNDEDFSSYENAGFLVRGAATIIDGIIINIGSFVITFIFSALVSLLQGNEYTQAFAILITFFATFIFPTIYVVWMTFKGGQTVGKMVMKIKVINQNPDEDLKLSTVILRETLAKFLSMIVFCIGYFVVAFKKTAWHDRIANTKVIKID